MEREAAIAEIAWQKVYEDDGQLTPNESNCQIHSTRLCKDT
jgi:hypothetical protein